MLAAKTITQRTAANSVKVKCQSYSIKCKTNSSHDASGLRMNNVTSNEGADSMGSVDGRCYVHFGNGNW